MRNCTVKIDNNGKVTVTQPIEYIEEHGATQLVITLNNELKDSTVSYYTLCFKPGAALKNPPDVKITSDMISVSEVSNGTISYALPSELTCFGSLDVQVQAHVIDSNDRMVSLIKSPVFRLYFEPSVTGDEEILIGEGEGFISLIHSALAQLNLTVEEVEELCDKLNEAFENGELNGPVMMPNVSEDGTLSWSNDAGLDNPPPVNIKGPKGDKGDKGDKGEDGVFSDELAEEITLNTAARHTHGNKELLDSLTESMIGTLDVYHELPEKANDGDVCIYTPANVPTVADSGKLIYVDWDVFNKTFAEDDFTQFTITFIGADGTEVGYIYATSWESESGGYDTYFQYIKGNEQWDIQFTNGVFDAESSAYINGESTTYFTQAPISFTLPYFSSLISDHENINGDVFYAPIRLMVYRDGWHEYSSAATVDVSIGRGHNLPASAKEGDLYLYTPQNSLTLTDSGKRIYIDWEKFKEPSQTNDPNNTPVCQFNADEGSGFITIECAKGNLYDPFCFFNIMTESYSTGTIINFSCGIREGVLERGELAIGDEITTYNTIDELPKYFQIPQFNTIYNLDFYGDIHNEYFFHTEYRLMKYQGGEWIEAVDKGVSQADMEAYVTSAINGSLDEIEALIDESGVLE